MKENFWEPVYQDAPSLSDQLLLPNLVLGKNIYFLSAFSPSYIFKLLRDLSISELALPGYLDVTYFIQGDLDLKADGIVRFRKFLLEIAEDREIFDFVGDALELIEKGILRLSIAYKNSSSALTKSCLGLIGDESDEFVAFADNKIGDFNSPIRVFRSWESDEYFDGSKILEAINKVHGAKPQNLRLVSGTEMVSWLEYLHEWYENNPPLTNETANSEKPSIDVLESATDELTDEDLVAFLSEFEEIASEGLYDLGPDIDDFDVSIFSDFGVVVDGSEGIGGHIPPLPEPIASLVGPASATCLCGNRFVRADGCNRVIW